MKTSIFVCMMAYLLTGSVVYAQKILPEVNVLLADSIGNVLDIKKPIKLAVYNNLRLVCKPENTSNTQVNYQIGNCNTTFFRKGYAITNRFFSGGVLNLQSLGLKKGDGATVTISEVSKLDSNGNRVLVRNRTPVFSFYFE